MDTGPEQLSARLYALRSAWLRGGVDTDPALLADAAARLVAVEAERDEALAALKDEMQWDMGGVPENEWMRRAISAEARCHTYEEALRPFAGWLDGFDDDDWRNTYSDDYPIHECRQKLGDYRRARAVLASSVKQEKGEGLGGSAAARSAGEPT